MTHTVSKLDSLLPRVTLRPCEASVVIHHVSELQNNNKSRFSSIVVL